jgi:hypothetical protein
MLIAIVSGCLCVQDPSNHFSGSYLRLSQWLPATSLLEELIIHADYMNLHSIIDKATLSRLKVLRITCDDLRIVLDGVEHHQDVIERMHLPVLEQVDVTIRSEFDVSDAELLMPFASAARRGILVHTIDNDLSFDPE